jgi:pimeloyl-ACP methyl ester carboxylesterase
MPFEITRRGAVAGAMASVAIAATPIFADPVAGSSYGPASTGDGAGPWILRVGRREAPTILVLLAGYGIGAGLMTVLAQQLAVQSTEVEVWVMDRREQALSRRAAELNQPPSSADEAAARGWGLSRTVHDIRSVVSKARRGGRRVFLGGHSWGATTALAFAAWDFSGRPGHREIDGLILIDGGVLDSFAGEGIIYRMTPDDARRRMREIEDGSPFDSTLSGLVGSQAPDAMGRFYMNAARAALAAPNALSEFAEDLPAGIAPAGPVTNLALIGWLFDAGPVVPDLHVDVGELDREGSPRRWLDSGRTPISTFTRALASRAPLAFEWFWPRRLALDLKACDRFVLDEVTRGLGLELGHVETIDVPALVFQTGLTHGSVFAAADRLASRCRIPRLVKVEDPTMGHLDPLFARASANSLIEASVAFMARRERAPGYSR